MAGKNILILGAGIGGIVTAKRLRKKLGQEHRIILVDKSAKHVFQPSIPRVMLGQRRPEQIQRDLRFLNRKGIKFVRGEVSQIDVEKHLVRIGAQEEHYDILVVALGAATNSSEIPGLEETGYNLHSVESVQKLAGELDQFSGGKVAIVVCRLPFKCPAGPPETALQMRDYFNSKGFEDAVDVDIYTAEPRPMAAAGPGVSEAVASLLQSRGIGYHSGHLLGSVNPAKNELNFEGGEKAEFDLLLAIPPHESPAAIKESKLVGEGGWAPVNRRTLQTNFDDVYAIGDVTSIGLPGRYEKNTPLMLPKAGVFAHEQAVVVAHNIDVQLKNSGSLREFKGDGSCFLEVGEGKAGFASGNFYAEPHPLVQMKNPARWWRWGKMLYERYWFWKWF